MFTTQDFRQQVGEESHRILSYWLNLVDKENGGFHCYADHQGVIDKQHDKAVLLHSRILWSFSQGYRILGNPAYLEAATHCYHFLRDYALDKEFGGVYWMLDNKGQPLDEQKHIYNQGFAIYALSEYYLASQDKEALNHAKELFALIEDNAFDSEFGGYLEAFDRQWNAIDNHLVCDTSEGVLAEKSMNTHLHIMEAYTTLHRAWPDTRVQQQLDALVRVTMDKIVDAKNHYGLFFARDWTLMSTDVSYGHDIEGTWLMDEAAGQLKSRYLASDVFERTLEMAKATLDEGVDRDGGIFNELRHGQLIDADRIWWVQAEAMIGFFNAFQKQPQPEFLQAAQNCWRIIQTQLMDMERGEWYWKVDRMGNPDKSKPKIEPWKCPYHNSRACLEVYARLENASFDSEILQ